MSKDPNGLPPDREPTSAAPHSFEVPAEAHHPTTTAPPPDAVHFTRAAALWSSLIVGLLILIVLLVFITQNTDSVEMSFLVWHWQLPLGVQILLAAVAGALLAVFVGAARIFQLRRAAKKNYKAALK